MLIFSCLITGISVKPAALAFFRLTTRAMPDKLVNVKIIRPNNSFLTNLMPDMTAELRGGDVRTVSYDTAHLCRSIRFFCALSIEGVRCVVKNHTKTKDNLTGKKVIDFRKEQAIQEIVPMLREMPTKFITHLAGVVIDYCQQSRNPGHRVKPSEDERRKALLSLIPKLLVKVSTAMLDELYDILTENRGETIQTSA